MILYYIVHMQETPPERHSTSEAAVTSQLGLGPELFPALRDVLTLTLALNALCSIFFPKNILLNLFFLGMIFL
jgi:hypothetical protein